MLKNRDLVTIFEEIDLSTLKLIWCHLVNNDAWKLCNATKHAKKLKTLVVYKIDSVSMVDLQNTFPNLQQLAISNTSILREEEETLQKTFSEWPIQRFVIWNYPKGNSYQPHPHLFPLTNISYLKTLTSLHLRPESYSIYNHLISPTTSAQTCYQIIKSLPKLRFFYSLVNISDISAIGPLGVVDCPTNVPLQEQTLLFDLIKSNLIF